MGQVKREDVLERRSISIATNPASCMGAPSEADNDSRIFLDSLKIGDQSIPQNIVGVDGGQNSSDVGSTVNAAAIVTRMRLDPGMNVRIFIEVLCLLDSDQRSKITGALFDAKKRSESRKGFKIELGSSNKNQEFKTDGKWEKMLDLSSLELYPSSKFHYVVYTDEQADDVNDGGLAETYISLEGLTTDKQLLDCVHDMSTEKGQIVLNYKKGG